jgi:hypothetical protein
MNRGRDGRAATRAAIRRMDLDAVKPPTKIPADRLAMLCKLLLPTGVAFDAERSRRNDQPGGWCASSIGKIRRGAFPYSCRAGLGFGITGPMRTPARMKDLST